MIKNNFKIFNFYFLLTSNLFSNPKVDVKTAILLDFDSNEIIYELEPDMSIYPASMTKIMTSIIVFDLLKENNFQWMINLLYLKKLGDYLKVDIHQCF